MTVGGGGAGGVCVAINILTTRIDTPFFISLTAMQKLNVVYNFTKINYKFNDLISEYVRSHQLIE